MNEWEKRKLEYSPVSPLPIEFQDLLDGKLTPVTGHISRSKSKFHDVEPHLRKKRKPPFLNGEESYKKKPPFLNGEPT